MCRFILYLNSSQFNPLRRSALGRSYHQRPAFFDIFYVYHKYKTPKSSTKRRQLAISSAFVRLGEEIMPLAHSPTSHCNLYNLCLVSETRISVRLAGVSVSFVGRCALWGRKGEPSRIESLTYCFPP